MKLRAALGPFCGAINEWVGHSLGLRAAVAGARMGRGNHVTGAGERRPP